MIRIETQILNLIDRAPGIDLDTLSQELMLPRSLVAVLLPRIRTALAYRGLKIIEQSSGYTITGGK